LLDLEIVIARIGSGVVAGNTSRSRDWNLPSLSVKSICLKIITDLWDLLMQDNCQRYFDFTIVQYNYFHQIQKILLAL
jgi:hypothetical protein